MMEHRTVAPIPLSRFRKNVSLVVILNSVGSVADILLLFLYRRIAELDVEEAQRRHFGKLASDSIDIVRRIRTRPYMYRSCSRAQPRSIGSVPGASRDGQASKQSFPFNNLPPPSFTFYPLPSPSTRHLYFAFVSRLTTATRSLPLSMAL